VTEVFIVGGLWSYCQSVGFVTKRKTNQLDKFKKEKSAGTQRN